jgi:hypothetical protein
MKSSGRKFRKRSTILKTQFSIQGSRIVNLPNSNLYPPKLSTKFFNKEKEILKFGNLEVKSI